MRSGSDRASQNDNNPDWDVIVIGAGPGGATAAALLAEQGFRTLVLEKDTFPRAKIDESLLPALMPVLDRLKIKPNDDTYACLAGVADGAGDRLCAAAVAGAVRLRN